MVKKFLVIWGLKESPQLLLLWCGLFALGAALGTDYEILDLPMATSLFHRRWAVVPLPLPFGMEVPMAVYR